MQLASWLSTLAAWVLSLAIPILLVVTPLYIYISPGFVRHEYRLKHIPPSDLFTSEERLRISDPILLYLLGRASVDEMAATRTDHGLEALRPDEVQHLVDVKVVTDGFFAGHRIAMTAALLALAVLLTPPARPMVPNALRQGVWIAGGLMVFVLIFAAIDFDLFFTRFHQIFFTAESWLFYWDDTLIQLYPLPFWVDAVWKVAATILVEAGLLLVGARQLERREWIWVA